jgi:hypothetical protein
LTPRPRRPTGSTNATEYVTYAAEGHGWREVEPVRDYLAKLKAFLLKCVIER